MLESMFKVDVHYRSKIGDIQQDLGSIMLNTNESFRSHCKFNPVVHSPSSNEEDIEDDDTDNKFWQNPTIRCSSSNKEYNEDDGVEDHDVEDEGSEDDAAEDGGVD